MIIIGHPLIPFTALYKVSTKDEIKNTKPNSTLLIDFSNTKLLQYAKSQDIDIALHVKSITDACLANALNAKFILVDENIAKNIQELATEYLFDTKILLYTNSKDGIEKAAINFIDGVLFKEGVEPL